MGKCFANFNRLVNLFTYQITTMLPMSDEACHTHLEITSETNKEFILSTIFLSSRKSL